MKTKLRPPDKSGSQNAPDNGGNSSTENGLSEACKNFLEINGAELDKALEILQQREQ